MSHNLINTADGRQNYGSIGGPHHPPEVAFAGFSPTEFYNLCENITTNIYTVNSSWKNLEKAVKIIGTNKDNQGLRDNMHVSQLSTNQIISATSKDLHRLTMVVRRGDKQQKLQVEKLTNDFKEAVATYSKLQQQVAEKMKANFLPVLSLENSGKYDTEDEVRGQLAQAQMSREIAFEQEMLIERESRIKQIEVDILDVNQIMRELSTLVHEQGETIDTIENGIDHGAGNIEEGTAQLIKAANYQSKYRRKLCLLALVGAIVIAVLIGVIIWDLKR